MVIMTKWLLVLLTVYCSALFAAEPNVFRVYLDADRTGHIESARSIEQGVRVAFSEVGDQIGGVPVEFVVLDHRGNSLRSLKNMERFSKDPNGLVYISGMHSPPLIKYRQFINESQMLTLVPWAAGAPITRYPSSENNFVFRLSVDDSKVGRILVKHALANQCQQPQLMLENTAWGKSNYEAMKSALPEELKAKVQVTWFNWGISDIDARIKIRESIDANADCLLLVSNSREGRLIVQGVSDLKLHMPVYSHWGITGGDFAQKVSLEIRDNAQLHFIQSCFNFYSQQNNDFQQDVFKRAQALYPDDYATRNIAAPAGFVHSYDLAKIFLHAADNTGLTHDAKLNQRKLKASLESLTAPIQGLIKQYHQPFRVFSSQDLDAHEALGPDDLCMAKYDENNAVKIIH
ncbi:hypothetical protein A1QI_17740 [Vibrio genomosp. F10 str. 9ZB36]|nr:hypothetical protein A1QI_17740 [Vibrio genomosp. F10 str. 9ZB36]